MQCPACGYSYTGQPKFCPDCGNRLQHGAALAHSDTAVRLGRALGPSYEIGEIIGRGGFGEVYTARDRSLNRVVAVKVLRADIADSAHSMQRFRYEAEALGRLRHPHIMPVFGIGEGEGLAYFVMPRIEGESIAALQNRGEHLTLSEACRVISEVGDALAAAHRAGVIHRDIKPDNILIEGEGRHALLMDFGVAKSASPDAKLTGTGVIIGTPMYMSPEQASGDVIGPAADIYSLGLVAYELLARRSVFGRASSPQMMMAAHLSQEPEDLRRVNPRIPGSVARAVMRCLRKAPEDRWANATEFAKAFRLAREDVPSDTGIVVPDEPPMLSPTVRSAVLALGVIGLAAVFGIFGLAPLSHAAPRLTREAARAEVVEAVRRLGVPVGTTSTTRYYIGGYDVIRLLDEGRIAPLPIPQLLSRLVTNYWQTTHFTPGKGGYVRANVFGSGWLSGFTRVLDTTVFRAGDPKAGGPVDAKQALAAVGWSTDSLKLLDSSRTVVLGRIRHTFNWEAPVVRLTETDSITRRLNLTFTDRQLTSFGINSTSSRFQQEIRRDRRWQGMFGLVVIVIIALVIGNVVTGFRRQRLRIRVALTMGIATAVVFSLGIGGVTNLPGGPTSSSFSPELTGLQSWMLTMVFSVLVIASMAAFVTTVFYLAIESAALAKAPHLLAGYQLLGSWHSLRSLSARVPIGASTGFGVAAVATLAAFAVGLVGPSPLRVTQVATGDWRSGPAVVFLSVALPPVCVAILALIALHLGGARSWVRSAIASVGISALVGFSSFGFSAAFVSSMAVPDAVLAGVVAGAIVGTLLWRGVLEATVAMIAATLSIETAQAWRAPSADLWPLTLALVLLLVIGIVALIRPPPRLAPA